MVSIHAPARGATVSIEVIDNTGAVSLFPLTAVNIIFAAGAVLWHAGAAACCQAGANLPGKSCPLAVSATRSEDQRGLEIGGRADAMMFNAAFPIRS